MLGVVVIVRPAAAEFTVAVMAREITFEPFKVPTFHTPVELA
jgi:hypothetical protein